MNQGYKFPEGSLSNRDNVRGPIQFERESQPSIWKDCFSSSTDPSIFTSIVPVLLDWSSRTSWVFSAKNSRSHFLPQSTMSHRSDSSSDANSSCCHRSDAWSHLEQRVYGAMA